MLFAAPMSTTHLILELRAHDLDGMTRRLSDLLDIRVHVLDAAVNLGAHAPDPVIHDALDPSDRIGRLCAALGHMGLEILELLLKIDDMDLHQLLSLLRTICSGLEVVQVLLGLVHSLAMVETQVTDLLLVPGPEHPKFLLLRPLLLHELLCRLRHLVLGGVHTGCRLPLRSMSRLLPLGELVKKLRQHGISEARPLHVEAQPLAPGAKRRRPDLGSHRTARLPRGRPRRAGRKGCS
mmetsp:Transcript_8552/g.18961  ORF Transcript_8552/g.18961 Transcript_8552/m.18961 type:complete len:237 (+) Transcript_8552:356-1066(+)